MKPNKPQKLKATKPAALFAEESAVAEPEEVVVAPAAEEVQEPAAPAQEPPAERSEFRLLVGRHGRFENGQNTLYVAGDRIWLTPAEAQSLGLRVGPPGAKTPVELAEEAAAAKGGSAKTSKAQRGI